VNENRRPDCAKRPGLDKIGSTGWTPAGDRGLVVFLVATVIAASSFAVEARADAGTVPQYVAPAHGPHRVLQASGIGSPVSDPPLNCRYGAAIVTGADQAPWLSVLGAGWYQDFSTHYQPVTTTSPHTQVIRVHQNKTGCTYLDGYFTEPSLTESALGIVIAGTHGALWLVGNEPDRGPNLDRCAERAQDDTFPEVYAQAYHDAYTFIKAHDPTALVANAGLVEVTPGRLQYLDKVWAAYLKDYGTPMPVDVWNIHLYVLPETTPTGLPNSIANVALGTDPALGRRESGGLPDHCSDPNIYCLAEADDMTAFAEQVVAMRTWMKQHGQQNKPLILSEYSLLYPYTVDPNNPQGCLISDEYGGCFTPNRVTAFMQASFDYMESATDPNLGYPLDGYRLIQRWLWFSLNTTGAGSVSNLLDGSPLALTQQGQAFKGGVAERTPYANLAPAPIDPVVGGAERGPASVTLTAQVYNTGTNGNLPPFAITFYADEALQTPIDSVVVPDGLPGCGQRVLPASVTWSGLAPGTHRFWVMVDSMGAVPESIETDNVASGVVTVYPHQHLVPLVRR
jgi:hypothetical protein